MKTMKTSVDQFMDEKNKTYFLSANLSYNVKLLYPTLKQINVSKSPTVL